MALGLGQDVVPTYIVHEEAQWMEDKINVDDMAWWCGMELTQVETWIEAKYIEVKPKLNNVNKPKIYLRTEVDPI